MLVEYSFQQALGIDLERCYTARSWRWFTVMVAGLLMSDTVLGRRFALEPTAQPTTETDPD